MKHLYLFSIGAIMTIFSSCIEEFKLPLPVQEESGIVIQGNLFMNAESVIYVNKPQAIGSKRKLKSIADAEVYIISQDGTESNKAIYDKENERYIAAATELNPEQSYAVKVIANGETYQSEFLQILQTPEITDLNYKEQEDGVSVHISTEGSNDASRYYMWSYEEDWEFHAELDIAKFAKGEIDCKSSFYSQIKGTFNPYYYCWRNNHSSQIFLYDTSVLGNNRITDHELYRISIDDQRISYIYSVLIKQWSIDAKTYEYYQTIEKQSENAGGLFSPMPMEIKGNVTCTSNPSKRTYGYVIASNVTTKRLFIYASDFQQLVSRYTTCDFSETGYDAARRDPLGFWRIAWSSEVRNSGAVIVYGNTTGEITEASVYYIKRCVDCRAVEGSTKQRPYFWPNNHE